MRGHRVQNKYTINFDKKIQEAMPRAGLSYRGKLRLSTTSQSASQTAPLVGEPLAKPFTLRGLPRPLPLGEVAPKVTERASLAGKSLCVAIGRLFVGAILSQCRAVWQRPCPLSRAYARQLPQRGSHWQAGPLSTGRLRPDMAQKGGPCYRGQHLLDKRTLSSCRWPRQRSTTVPETSCFARPAWA